MPLGERERAAAVEAWIARDLRVALGAIDRGAIGATGAIRDLFVELATARDPSPDLPHAAAAFGRILGAAGASPTLAASTLDHAPVPSEVAASHAIRAALLEGYAREREDAVRDACAKSWAPQRCVVPVDPTTWAVAAGIEADGDVVDAWAGRIAASAARAGVTKVHVAGEGDATERLIDALGVAGVAAIRAISPWPDRGKVRK